MKKAFLCFKKKKSVAVFEFEKYTGWSAGKKNEHVL